MLKNYTGNVMNTPAPIGLLPQPYYWWETGAMLGALIDYFHYTNDSTYNNITTQALVSQVGPNFDYIVPAQAFDEANDDQAFWGFSSMSAAEHGFPDPQPPVPSWLQLTINLWNTQAPRWDPSTCGGGLKWQFYPANNGYTYKNSVSNGGFFLLSARLARFTGNNTYLDWANRSYNWSAAIGLIDSNYKVYDGTDELLNCTQIDQIQWTYNLGMYLYGSALLYNYTNGSSVWEQRTKGFLSASSDFFSPFSNATDIMWEAACEGVNTCNTDQYSFKAYLARFMWASTLVAPFITAQVSELLIPSSKAAAGSCSGGEDGITCGQRWWVGDWDGTTGVGQQLCALEIIQGLLVNGSSPPLTNVDYLNNPPSLTTASSASPSMTATAPPAATTTKSEAGSWRAIDFTVLVLLVCSAFLVNILN